MQYRNECLNPNCTHCLAAPEETKVERDAKDHSEESGHYVFFTGRFDAPDNEGVWKDGELTSHDWREGVARAEHKAGEL